MTFNIVLFYFGTVSTKIDLYKKCYESIKSEFSKDNIIIFNSPDEVYEKLNIPKKGSRLLFETDYLRLSLSKHYENMLWFDADIDISNCNGFRDIIVSAIEANKDKDFISFSNSIGCFYSRKENDFINNIIEDFDFSEGDNMIRLKYFNKDTAVYNLDRCYNHYFCLNTLMDELSETKEFLIIDFKDIPYDQLLKATEIFNLNKMMKYKTIFTANFTDYRITQTEQLKVLFTTISEEDLKNYIYQGQKLRNNFDIDIKIIKFGEYF